MIKVSIIVPVYNQERYLDECVASILAQTFAEWELWLVDDGSTDASPAMCDAYLAKDCRVHVLHTENAGPGMARNRGLERAAGEFVMFVDSDDWIDPSFVEHLVGEAMRACADVVYAGLTIMRRGHVLRDAPNPLGRRMLEGDEVGRYVAALYGDDAFGVRGHVNVGPYASIFSREKIEAQAPVRFPRSMMFEDLVFNVRFCSRATRIACADFNGYRVRRDGQLSVSKASVGDSDLVVSALEDLRAMASREPEPRRAACMRGADRRIARCTRLLIRQIVGSEGSAEEKKSAFLALASNPTVGQANKNVLSMGIPLWEDAYAHSVAEGDWGLALHMARLHKAALNARMSIGGIAGEARWLTEAAREGFAKAQAYLTNLRWGGVK